MMASEKFTYSDFTAVRSVSRETFLRLETYTALLIKWQKTINLISNSTLPDVWQRHILDSAQLLDYIPEPDTSLADVGSGAGFPGLVLAIMGVAPITLVESDTRKAAFLQEAARVTGTKINVLNQRAEHVDYSEFTVITARALAPVKEALEILGRTLDINNKLLLIKGKNYRQELEEARKAWFFETETFPSSTDKEGVILSLTNIRKQGAA